jgi:hypothetical protein
MNWRNKVYLLSKIKIHCQVNLVVKIENPSSNLLEICSYISSFLHCRLVQTKTSFLLELTWRQPSRLPHKRRNSGNLPLAGPLPHGSIESPAFGYLNPHLYFSGFFITVNRSKQTMGDHLRIGRYGLITIFFPSHIWMWLATHLKSTQMNKHSFEIM